MGRLNFLIPDKSIAKIFSIANYVQLLTNYCIE